MKVPALFLVATGLVALSQTSARAGLNYNTTTGNDIIAAFSTGSGLPHTGTTYVLNLGNLSQFQGSFADGNLHTLNITGAAVLQDLTNAGIGASGTWSLFGADITDIQTHLLSKVETINGVQSTPYTRSSLATSAANDMFTAIFSSNYLGGTTAPNSDRIAATAPDGYGNFVFGTGQTQAWETYADNPEGAFNKILDLYLIAPGTGNAALIGGFKYDAATGTFQFSSDLSDFSTVPEPAAAGLLLLGVPLLASFRFRRRSAVAA